MDGIYDEKIIGAKERAAFARKLRENAMSNTGGMVGNVYVPNFGGAIQSIISGWQEGEAKKEQEDLQRDKTRATIEAMNKMGYEAPETLLKQAQIPEQTPSFLSKASAFLRGEDQPQPTPAQPYQQNVAQNITPDQQERAMINLSMVNPEAGNLYLQIEQAKRQREKEARKERMENVPTGFFPSDNGGITPMIMHTPQGDVPYDQYQLKMASEKGGIITPAQQQSIEMANKNYELANKRNIREEEKYQEEKNKPVVLNEGQSKAYYYANRMIDADKILSSLNDVNQTAVSLSRTAKNSLGEIGGNLANSMLSEKNQKAKNAQENFLTALLRPESGASIGPQEFETGNQIYFPQTGDKPELLAQKARNRQLAIQGLTAEIPSEYLKSHPFGEINKTTTSPSIQKLPSRAEIEAELANRAKVKQGIK